MRSRLVAVAAIALVLAGAAVAVALLVRSAPAPVPAANRAFDSRPAARPPFVVWAIGDGASGSAASSAIARRVARDRPDRVLYLGDVYESGTAEEFEQNVRGAYGPLLSRMLPTPGNHDWPNHLVGYDRFWAKVTGARTPPWYSVRLGPWQLLSLNSEAPHGADDPQLGWLRAELRRPAACRLAFWHRPRFSTGGHGDQDDVAPLWDAVVGRAALVLNGHDHDLQRFELRGETTEIVSGAGGKSHYAVDRRRAGLAFADDRHFGAVRLTLRRDRADVRVLAADGSLLDRARVPCRSGG